MMYWRTLSKKEKKFACCYTLKFSFLYTFCKTTFTSIRECAFYIEMSQFWTCFGLRGHLHYRPRQMLGSYLEFIMEKHFIFVQDQSTRIFNTTDSFICLIANIIFCLGHHCAVSSISSAATTMAFKLSVFINPYSPIHQHVNEPSYSFNKGSTRIVALQWNYKKYMIID